MNGESTRDTTPEAAGWKLGMGTLLQGLNSSMIVVAIAAITATFRDSAAIPWLVSSLYFTAAVCSPTFGHLADLYGAKRVYYAGLIITALGACIGPFAPNVWVLVAVRALIGIGTAAQMPTAVAIVMDMAHRQHHPSSPAVGTISMLGQVSSAIGPVLGGLIVSNLGWRWIFWINIPLILNAAWWIRKLPQPECMAGKRHVHIDWAGIALFCMTMIALLYGMLGETALAIVAGLACAVLGAIVFHHHETRTADPFIDFTFLASHRRLVFIYVRTIIVNIAFYTIFYGIPQWAELEGGMDATTAGFIMLPNFIAGIVTTKLAAGLNGRITPQHMRLLGGLLTILSMAIGLLAFGTGNTALFYLASFFLGIPSGFNVMGNQLEINHIVPEAQLGQATGLFRTMQFIGAAISTPLVHHVLGADNGTPIDMLMITIGTIGTVALVGDIFYHVRVRKHAKALAF